MVKKSHGLTLGLALLLVCAEAMASEAPDTERQCGQLETNRRNARSGNDWNLLEREAGKFIDFCRKVRSKTEVSIAMGEIAATRRNEGRLKEALSKSQECINYEYLGLTCHFEKARALNGLGLKSEAREVLQTSKLVIEKLYESGTQEIRVIEEASQKAKVYEFEARMKRGMFRLNLARSGEQALKNLESILQ